MAVRGRPPSAKTLVARAALAAYNKPASVTAKYDAAGTGRRMAGWNPPTQGPNRALTGLQNVRNRARDVTSNDWSGESAIQKWTTSLLGIGITPRFRRIKDAQRKAEIVDLWNDFVATSDADGVLNVYGQQTMVVRSWLDAGEVFARKRPRFADEGFAVPLQVQIIEAEFVPLLDTDSYVGLPAGNRIRSGIELDKRGRRVAYWIHKEHPGDSANLSIADGQLVRVLAKDICHIFEPKRPGQLRGVSMLAPILNRLKNIENYDDATLTRQQLANLVVGFITRANPEAGADDNIDPLTNQVIEQVGPTGPLLGMQPGILQELDDGQKMEWSNPPEAGTTYSDYMRTQHMGTAAAAGIPYEIFSGDIVNISDRTLRVLINEFRRFNEQRQWQIIIPMFCQPVIEWFTDAAVSAGLVTELEASDVRRVEHAPHGWAHIHPVQDPTGKKIEVENGFRSRASVVSERGDDIDAVDQERQDDDKRQQQFKIGPYSKANQQINAPPPPPPAPAPAVKPAAQTALEAAQIALAVAQEDVMRAQAHLIRNPSAQDFRDHASDGLMNRVVNSLENNPVNLEIAAGISAVGAAVTLLANRPEPIPQAAPIINVAAPVVHLSEQPAPIVQVDVHVPEQVAPAVNVVNHVQAGETIVNNTHPTRAVQVVERNGNDDVTKTVTTYKFKTE